MAARSGEVALPTRQTLREESVRFRPPVFASHRRENASRMTLVAVSPRRERRPSETSDGLARKASPARRETWPPSVQC